MPSKSDKRACITIIYILFSFILLIGSAQQIFQSGFSDNFLIRSKTKDDISLTCLVNDTLVTETSCQYNPDVICLQPSWEVLFYLPDDNNDNNNTLTSMWIEGDGLLHRSAVERLQKIYPVNQEQDCIYSNQTIRFVSNVIGAKVLFWMVIIFYCTVIVFIPIFIIGRMMLRTIKSFKQNVNSVYYHGRYRSKTDTCAICFKYPQTTCLDCGHNILCLKCTTKLMTQSKPECPICRQPVISFKKGVVTDGDYVLAQSDNV